MTPSPGLLPGSLGPSSATSAPGSTVVRPDRAGMPRVATDPPRDGSVVIASGGSTGNALTYNAAGMLNSLAVAQPTEIPRNGADTGQAIANTLPASTTAAGIYTATGTFQQPSTAAVSANWTAILEAYPELAGTVVAGSLARGITRTLIASA